MRRVRDLSFGSDRKTIFLSPFLSFNPKNPENLKFTQKPNTKKPQRQTHKNDPKPRDKKKIGMSLFVSLKQTTIQLVYPYHHGGTNGRIKFFLNSGL